MIKKYSGWLLLPIAALIGYLVWPKRPGPTVATVTSPAIAAATAASPNGPALNERAWQVHYTKGSSGMGVKEATKKWPSSIETLSNEIPATLAATSPMGKITIPAKRQTGRQMAEGRWYRPDGFLLIGSTGTPQGSIEGDPRALYCLDLLLQTAGLDGLYTLGMHVNQSLAGDQTHDNGYAIDIAGGRKNGAALSADETMNLLIMAAEQHHMPIAWISRYKKDGSWPMFQLRQGEKVYFSYSKADHTSHYHVVLPRPNWAVAVIN